MLGELPSLTAPELASDDMLSDLPFLSDDTDTPGLCGFDGAPHVAV